MTVPRKGGRPKGLPKTGGKKKGTFNKRTRAVKERLMREEALSVENTVEAIRRGQNYDIRRLFDAKGNLRPLHSLTEEEAWAIAGFEIVIKNAEAGDGHTDKVAKVKLMDRGRYVELAAKHQGMMTERLDINVTDVGAKLDAARLAASKRNALKR